MQHSDTIGAIAAALAKAQGAIKGALKDSTNPHFKSSYADLASVWAACRDQLSANELSVVQAPGECASGQLALTTILMHSSGEWLQDTLTIPLTKVDAQGYGSATTYARRYALASFVGVAPDDDDGHGAVNAKGAANDAPSIINAPLATKVAAPVKRVALKGIHKTLEAAKPVLALIAAEVRDAADKDALDAFLATHRPTLDQCREEFPYWWNGDGRDFLGLDKEIAHAYERIALDYGEQGDEDIRAGRVLVDTLRAG